MSDTEDDKLTDVQATAYKRKKGNAKQKACSPNVSKDNNKDPHLLETAKVGTTASKKKEVPKKKGKTISVDEDENKTEVKKPPVKKAQGTKKGDDAIENGDPNISSQREQQQLQAPTGKAAKKEPKMTAGKQAKLSDTDYQMLVEYMKESNKPFNSTTLESNLKSRSTLKKATLELALVQAVDEGYLTKKTYGSSLVFWYNQDLLPVVNKEEIEALTEATLKRQQEFSETNLNLRAANLQLSKIMQEKTDEQLQAEITRLTAVLEQQENQLQYYSSASFVAEDAAVVSSVENRLSKIESIHKKRKRMCEDTVRSIIESLEENKTLHQMFEVIGIDDPEQLS